MVKTAVSRGGGVGGAKVTSTMARTGISGRAGALHTGASAGGADPAGENTQAWQAIAMSVALWSWPGASLLRMSAQPTAMA